MITWKFNIKSLKCPTPKAIKKFADAMLAATSGLSLPAFMLDKVWVGIALILIGVIGRFLSSFFTEEAPYVPPSQNPLEQDGTVH